VFLNEKQVDRRFLVAYQEKRDESKKMVLVNLYGAHSSGSQPAIYIWLRYIKTLNLFCSVPLIGNFCSGPGCPLIRGTCPRGA
jgi:hypothetical protein